MKSGRFSPVDQQKFVGVRCAVAHGRIDTGPNHEGVMGELALNTLFGKSGRCGIHAYRCGGMPNAGAFRILPMDNLAGAA